MPPARAKSLGRSYKRVPRVTRVQRVPGVPRVPLIQRVPKKFPKNFLRQGFWGGVKGVSGKRVKNFNRATRIPGFVIFHQALPYTQI